MDSVESVEQRQTVAMVLRKVQGGSVYSRDWAESFMQETRLVKNMIVGLHNMEPVIDHTESKEEEYKDQGGFHKPLGRYSCTEVALVMHCSRRSRHKLDSSVTG